MVWHKITAGSKVYVLDPDRMHVRSEGGELLSPAEVVAGWREVGSVELLPDGVDPEVVMRESWKPTPTQAGGNIGMRPG